MLSLEELLEVNAFSIEGEEYENTISKDLEIDMEHLDQCFANQAKLMAIYGFAYDKAADQESRLKIELEKIYALLDAQTRNNFEVSGHKFTEKKVHNVVITSPEYQLKQNEYQQAKLVASHLKSACLALMHRRDMLVGLGANYRAQLNLEPTLSIK